MCKHVKNFHYYRLVQNIRRVNPEATLPPDAECHTRLEANTQAGRAK